VDVGRRDGTHGGQLRRRLLIVEHIEGPIADGATLQMRMVRSRAEEGADHDGVDTGGLLLGPGQCPYGIKAAAPALHSAGDQLAGAEQQMGVDLVECLPGVRIKQLDSCGEQAFLIPSGARAPP
jgi:hypothetical protein